MFIRGQWCNIEQKPGKVPASAHMGQNTTGNTNVTAQAFHPPPPYPLPPTRTPTLPSPHPPLLPPNHSLKVGGPCTFLVSIKCKGITPPNTSPTQLNSFPTQKCHLGKWYHFIC